jgi:hypothetical protein
MGVGTPAMMCAMSGARQRVRREIHSVNLMDWDWYVNWMIDCADVGVMRIARSRKDNALAKWDTG